MESPGFSAGSCGEVIEYRNVITGIRSRLEFKRNGLGNQADGGKYR
jgi:hypothetical protein